MVLSVAVGTLIGGFLYVMIVISSVGVFGSEETSLLTYPTLESARDASLNVGQRLDALFLIIWVVSVYTSLYATYYFSVYAGREIMGLSDHRMLSTFCMPIVFAVAQAPLNFSAVYKTADLLYLIGLPLTAGYPAILLLISLMGKGRRAHE